MPAVVRKVHNAAFKPSCFLCVLCGFVVRFIVPHIWDNSCFCNYI